MLIIAHRGLLEGPDKELENHPDQLLKAIRQGFDIEVDMWYNDSGLWLGHDEPQYLIEEAGLYPWLYGLHSWIHAKDLATMVYLMEEYSSSNIFYHTDEDVVLTSQKYMWAHPTKRIDGAICVLPELYPERAVPKNAFGICTDYAINYRKEYE